MIFEERGSKIMTKEQLWQEWRTIITQYEAGSIKKRSEWCKENDVNLRSFNRWYKKLRNQTSAPHAKQGWIPAQIVDESCDYSYPRSLCLKIGKASIEVRDDFNPLLLARVAKVLGEIC